ncbi:RNA polymerase sigma factor [Planctomicrobium sp. SH668]|uniref:RNA polymerase sigma factor n=1 Tax=Planctomicrobium sp. SH668 TaxID=3448126 RepID=UPI003F5B7F15
MPYVEIDRRILNRCLKREPKAWEEFVDRFIGVFVHVIRHTAHCRSIEITNDDVEDLCAEVYLTLLKNDFAVLRHFKGNSSLATYLTVVARRIVVKAITTRRKSEALGHTYVHQHSLALSTGDPPRSNADVEEVRSLLGHLSETDASLVRMYYLEGLSYQEISRRHGIPENSIGPTLHRLRERMRRGRHQGAH